VILVPAEQSDVSSLPQHSMDASEMKLELDRAPGVLAESDDLLDGHAATWYTQEQHERAGFALQQLQKS